MFRPHLETLGGGETVKKQLMENTYVNNVMRLVSNEDQGTQFIDESIRILGKDQLPFAKWESNLKSLNDEHGRADTKLLGINWNKERDTYSVEVSYDLPASVTQRTMLKTLATNYDPVGLLAPTLVDGKHLYRLAVDEEMVKSVTSCNRDDQLGKEPENN